MLTPPTRASEYAVHGVLITFRRPSELAGMLACLAAQGRKLNSLIVIDNDGDRRIEALVKDGADAANLVQYIPAPANLGPAGGLALGATHVLREANDSDWIIFFDDDNPPRTPNSLAEITAFAEEMLRRDPDLAGVGLIGARVDIRTGLGVRLPDEALVGPIEVDYVGGNQLPCLRVAAIRDVGLPDPRLFFGFEELEYGLRLRSAGRRLYASGELWRREREAYGRQALDPRPARTVRVPSWRDYYSTRNLVWILRRNRSHLGAARVALRRAIVKPLYSLPYQPRAALAHLALGIRATFDGYTGRMGRTVEPATSKPPDAAFKSGSRQPATAKEAPE